MSSIPVKDADSATRKVDTFERTESGEAVHVQAIAVVNPATGEPLAPAADGRMPAFMAEVGNVDDTESPSGAGSVIALIKRLRTLITDRLPTLINGGIRIAGYDTVDDMVKVKSVQKKWRDSFTGSTLNIDKWEQSLGTGGAVAVSGGQLTMGSGTTINSESYILSKETFTIPFRVGIGLTLSQRIANQSFFVEAISVDPATGVPDGQHVIGLVFDGTSHTAAKYRVQNSGAVPLDSTAQTFPTTLSGSLFELEPFADECWFHGGTLDSTNARANSYRRHQQIPEPNAVFKIRLRWLNAGIAPGGNTNAVVQYIQVQDYAELTAEITAGRGQAVAGQALGVQVVNTPAVTLASTTANVGTSGITPYTDSSTNLGASATFTGTSRDAGATPAYNLFVANAFADQAGTLRNEKSTDGTTWRLAGSVALAAGEAKELTTRVTTRYNRTVFVNGATLQGSFSLTSAYQRQ